MLTNIANLQVEGIREQVILDYFNQINQENFAETADLFVTNGVLLAPFESAIEGRDAIASYLAAEAKGMKLYPCQGVKEALEDNLKLIKVTGKVQTPLFSVNVRWEFIINPSQKIEAVKIKLLASPQELLKLRR